MKNIILKIIKTYAILTIFILILALSTQTYTTHITQDEIITLTIHIIISIMLYIIISEISNSIERKNDKIVKNVSTKYKAILAINDKYNFIELESIYRKIIEREYSHKSFDRARASQIILYNLENNIDGIREFILNAYKNKKEYDRYIKQIECINEIPNEEFLKKIHFSQTKYNRVEKRIINQIQYDESVYDIIINVIVYYTTPAGRNTYKKNRIFNYNELCDLYMQWRNGKKYAETARRERKYLNDSMRYDVLKRDRFTCQKCGATAKDGAKLHVDHIIPVSKGGQTTMSNLQTLCERCNIGKSNKDN